ncbi:hypothetical protein D3C78_1751010 [compost metagenome]
MSAYKVPTYSVADTRERRNGSWLDNVGTWPDRALDFPQRAPLLASNCTVPSTTVNGDLPSAALERSVALASVRRIS